MRSLPLTFIAISCCVLAQPDRLQSDDQSASPSAEICATVDTQPIYQREVEREVARVLGGREITASARAALHRESLKQLIDRRLVLKFLADRGLGASPQEIDRQMRRIRTRLAREDMELDDYLKKADLTLQQLQHATAWEIGWKRFLAKQLTDENLARYFAKNQREFDGTELRVAHILVKVDPPNDAQALKRAVSHAEDVRRRIGAGEVSFADAVVKHSSAASATDGGQIGRIGRRQPMPEAFSQSAFGLDKGQISEPVVTAFGVHLIQCQEVFPGDRQWEEVHTELEQEVTRYLFQWAADQQRPRSQIDVLK